MNTASDQFSCASTSPPQTVDYYDVLGCSRDSEPDQIRAEYLQRARKWHPDKAGSQREPGGGPAVAQWNRIREAYEVLGDARTKAQYDRWRSARLPMSFAQWLNTSAQGQSMHWAFDYQRTLPHEARNSTAGTGGGGAAPSDDIYRMFRNYEI
ncbi:DnaJ sub C member 12 [Coemansia sp. Benny D160-2]|nr:DnaJ sub C member 12 [Coemansia sp. Benny D160-2]